MTLINSRRLPCEISPDERQREIAAILAGALRLHQQRLTIRSIGPENELLAYSDRDPNLVQPLATPRLLITPREAAFALSISTRKLWSLTNAGEIPCVRLGRAVRYSPAALQAWIQGQQGVSR